MDKAFTFAQLKNGKGLIEKGDAATSPFVLKGKKGEKFMKSNWLSPFTSRSRPAFQGIRMPVFVTNAVIQHIDSSINGLAERTFVGGIFSGNVKTGTVIG
jgi:hypothetical protein